MAKKKKGRSFWGIAIFLLLFSAALFIVFRYYQKIYASAVQLNQDQKFLHVHSDWSRSDLIQHLYQTRILLDTQSFIWVADQKQFTQPKPGRYQLKPGMSNNSLINLLRSGRQTPVTLTFNTIRLKSELASKVSKSLELDSASLHDLLRREDFAVKYGFNRQTILCLFLPNTYEFYWDTNAEEFVDRMAREYKKFWTDERKAKAKAINLSQSEVSILASIVQAEQSAHPDERARVAGLYINRLKRGIRLQSDPTLVYALGDFGIRRVLNEHKELNSPYNTYKYAGLPPGPINLPEISSLDAVLNYEKHDYLYMCAKADFSGYHHFSKTLRQHNVYANQYRRELNRRKILN